MVIEIARPGKNSLLLSTPVMPAAGTFGFGDAYRRLVNFDKLGAIVTNPVTVEEWHPASGTRVVPLDAGILVHTGLPNPGLERVVLRYRPVWERMPTPIILHLLGTSVEHMRRARELLDEVDVVAAIELGLDDEISYGEAVDLTREAAKSEKPLLVRLPFYQSHALAEALAEAGADALVISAPPRGTARDKNTGRLVSGRVYGPLIKPLALRMVGRLRRLTPTEIPIIGAGGIHSPQDARDFIDAGAVAVQVDTATWSEPKMLERIARDLGGWIATRKKDALMDEWHPDASNTEPWRHKA